MKNKHFQANWKGNKNSLELLSALNQINSEPILMSVLQKTET